MRRGLAALLVLLSACSTAPESGVSGDYWKLVDTPLLTIEVVEVGNLEFWCRGVERGYNLTQVRACASRSYSSDPKQNVCVIYVRPVWANTESIINHEKCHCMGYDHDQVWSGVSCPVPVEHLPYTRSKISTDRAEPGERLLGRATWTQS